MKQPPIIGQRADHERVAELYCDHRLHVNSPCIDPAVLHRHLSIDYSQVAAAAQSRHLAAEEADALSKKLARSSLSSVRVDSQDTWQRVLFPFFSPQGEG